MRAELSICVKSHLFSIIILDILHREGPVLLKGDLQTFHRLEFLLIPDAGQQLYLQMFSVEVAFKVEAVALNGLLGSAHLGIGANAHHS